MWLGVFATPAFLLLIPLAPLIFHWSGHEPAVAELETTYFQILMWSATANVFAAAQAGFFSGRGHTRVVMFVDLASVVLNLMLDALLILGLFGLPRLGIVGAGWATVVASWVKVFAYAWLIYRDENREAFHFRSTIGFDRRLFMRLLNYGAPSGLQMFVEAGSFTLLALLMGRFGKLAMTATTLALNVNAVAVIPIVGLSVATSIAVGQQITRGRPDLAARASWTSLHVCLIYTISFASLYVLMPDLLLSVYAVGANPAEFAEIRAMTLPLLRFVAAFCVLDGIQMVFSGAVKGAGDTWFVLRATFFISAAIVVLCWMTMSQGLMAWWAAITLWVAVLAVVFAVRFLQGKWQTMQVIEPDVVEEPLEAQPVPAAEVA
jgi:MATE family multidrug resistance protein